MLGDYVTVGVVCLCCVLTTLLAGHRCILTACTVEDECLVGMGSVLEEGTLMQKQSMLAAGSVLKTGSRIGSGEVGLNLDTTNRQLWMGNPARFLRKLTEKELLHLRKSADNYAQLAREYQP